MTGGRFPAVLDCSDGTRHVGTIQRTGSGTATFTPDTAWRPSGTVLGLFVPCDDTQFTRALARAAAECDPDPQAVVAPFNSAF